MFWDTDSSELSNKWNIAADDYQNVFEAGMNDYSRKLMDFLLDNSMLIPSCRVIDLGCGVGKYGTYFAALGCDVTLLDISGTMLRFASENMSGFKTPWRVYEADFNDLSGEEEIFKDGFYLSTSMMSSAVQDVESVKKMSRFTHGYAFVTRFYDWKQPFRDLIMKEMAIERDIFDDLKGDCSVFCENVREAGFEPRIEYVDYDWADERTPQQMADYFVKNYLEEGGDEEAFRSKVKKAASRHTNEKGLVTDDVQTKVAWIYWKTR